MALKIGRIEQPKFADFKMKLPEATIADMETYLSLYNSENPDAKADHGQLWNIVLKKFLDGDKGFQTAKKASVGKTQPKAGPGDAGQPLD